MLHGHSDSATHDHTRSSHVTLTSDLLDPESQLHHGVSTQCYSSYVLVLVIVLLC